MLKADVPLCSDSANSCCEYLTAGFQVYDQDLVITVGCPERRIAINVKHARRVFKVLLEEAP